MFVARGAEVLEVEFAVGPSEHRLVQVGVGPMIAMLRCGAVGADNLKIMHSDSGTERTICIAGCDGGADVTQGCGRGVGRCRRAAKIRA